MRKNKGPKAVSPQEIRIQLDILRREPGQEPYVQSILYTTEDGNATVASALTDINNDGTCKDIKGNPVTTIRWECSCLQKKCGACAMVVDGRPVLACNSFLKDYRKKSIRIEPLRKFPVIADLIVDRKILYENLKTLQLWSRDAIYPEEKNIDTAYEASRCLQCGCCLEVCPNFCPEGTFFGAAGFVPTARLLSSLKADELKRMQEAYYQHGFKGCGKSLSCANVCPAGIDTENLLVNSNAGFFRRKRG